MIKNLSASAGDGLIPDQEDPTCNGATKPVYVCVCVCVCVCAYTQLLSHVQFFATP